MFPRLLVAGIVLMLGVPAAHASDSALLDVLVQKGYLTVQEANDIKAEASSAKTAIS